MTPGGLAEALAGLAGDPAAHERVDEVMRLVEGFETPYSVELLATVPFASSRGGPAPDDRALSDVVASWSLRKARLSTDEHVRVAAGRLREHDLPVG